MVIAHEDRSEEDRVVFWRIATAASKKAALAAVTLGGNALAERITVALAQAQRSRICGQLDEALEELRSLEGAVRPDLSVGRSAQHALAYARWSDYGPFRTADKIKMARLWLLMAEDSLLAHERMAVTHELPKAS